METRQALDVIEALLLGSEHPDIVEVSRYGRDAKPGGQSPSGVKTLHQTGSSAMLWGAVEPRDATAVPLVEQMPPPRWRAARLLVFVHQLLDAAQPSEFRRWELCQSSGVVSPVASAIRIAVADGSTVYLRATAASGATGEPEEDPFQDYRIPEGVRQWHRKASVLTAA